MSGTAPKRVFWPAMIGCGLLICACLIIPLSIQNSPITFYEAILAYLFLPTDEQLVNQYFGPQIPGYLKAEIVESKGKGDSHQDPRLVTIRATLDIWPSPVTCMAQIHYFRGDPGLQGFHWFNLECVGQGDLIGRAYGYLTYSDYGVYHWCPDDNAALLLKYWVEKGRIKVTDVKHPAMRSRVSELLEKRGPLPAARATGTSLFRISDINVKDHAPELPEEKKVKQYVLRCDGTLEVFLLKSYAEPLDLKIGDTVLSPPLTPPANLIGP